MNDYELSFEIDTGTFNTIISVHDWNKIGSPKIHPSTFKLRCYSGNDIKVKGECNVSVKYNNHVYNLRMIVVFGSNLPLLGLQWIRIIKLDMNSIIHSQINDLDVVNNVYSLTKLQTTLNKF